MRNYITMMLSISLLVSLKGCAMVGSEMIAE